MMDSAGTPSSITLLISTFEAQSKDVPSDANVCKTAMLSLHFTAETKSRIFEFLLLYYVCREVNYHRMESRVACVWSKCDTYWRYRSNCRSTSARLCIRNWIFYASIQQHRIAWKSHSLRWYSFCLDFFYLLKPILLRIEMKWVQ